MRVLDLFSGTGGWSDPWRETGHDVRRIELDPGLAERTGAIVADINDTRDVLDRLDGFKPDVVLASPPCNAFTVMRIGRMWNHNGTPKHPDAEQGLRNVVSTLRLILLLEPKWWVIENPRGKLRSLEVMAGLPRHTVWYCRFGEDRAKPTDLWAKLPLFTALELDKDKYQCANGNPDHTAAPRGSTTGTQGGVSREEAYRIPQPLARLIRDGILARSTPHAWLRGSAREDAFDGSCDICGQCVPCEHYGRME